MARRICRAAVTGGDPDPERVPADEIATLANVLDLTRRICARLGKEPGVNLVELSGKVDELTLAMEKFASGAEKTGAALAKVLAAPGSRNRRNREMCRRTIIGKSRPTSTAGQTRSAGIAFDCRRSRWPSPYPPSLCSVCCLSNNSRSCRSTIRPAAGAPTSGRTTAARSSIARRMRDGRTRRSSAGFPFARLDGPAKPAAFSSFTLQTRCPGRAARVVADLPDGRARHRTVWRRSR